MLRRLHRIGQGSISADQGLIALGAVLHGAAATDVTPAPPQLAVNAFSWDTYLQSSQPAFFSEMAPAPVEPELALLGARRAGQSSAGRSRQTAAGSVADPAAVREQVKREVAAAILQVGGAPGRKHALSLLAGQAHGAEEVAACCQPASMLHPPRPNPVICLQMRSGAGICRRRGRASHVRRA